MTTFKCITKIKTKKNIVKRYILMDLDTHKEQEVPRRDVVKMLRDRENYTITNLQLTYNNRVTHKGLLSEKAKSIIEDTN